MFEKIINSENSGWSQNPSLYCTCICMIEPLSVCAGVSVYSSLLSTVKVPVLQCMPVWRQKKKKQTGSAALPCHTELTPIVVWTLLELRKETRVTAAGHTHTHTHTHCGAMHWITWDDTDREMWKQHILFKSTKRIIKNTGFKLNYIVYHIALIMQLSPVRVFKSRKKEEKKLDLIKSYHLTS